VSNFDVNLLDELLEFAVVKPHAVQNFATPGSIDTEVRLWCKKHQVVYQPYASIRNLDSLPEDLTIALNKIAVNRGVSIHSVATRFFIQVILSLGCSVISVAYYLCGYISLLMLYWL
jgi:diketogulonate reductase-like aldo/keto reductase